MSNTDRIELALCDPDAPWYGSDLVSWVGDLINEHKQLRKAAQRALNVFKGQGESVRPGNVLGALSDALCQSARPNV